MNLGDDAHGKNRAVVMSESESNKDVSVVVTSGKTISTAPAKKAVGLDLFLAILAFMVVGIDL